MADSTQDLKDPVAVKTLEFYEAELPGGGDDGDMNILDNKTSLEYEEDIVKDLRSKKMTAFDTNDMFDPILPGKN